MMRGDSFHVNSDCLDLKSFVLSSDISALSRWLSWCFPRGSKKGRGRNPAFQRAPQGFRQWLVFPLLQRFLLSNLTEGSKRISRRSLSLLHRQGTLRGAGEQADESDSVLAPGVQWEKIKYETRKRYEMPGTEEFAVTELIGVDK